MRQPLRLPLGRAPHDIRPLNVQRAVEEAGNAGVRRKHPRCDVFLHLFRQRLQPFRRRRRRLRVAVSLHTFRSGAAFEAIPALLKKWVAKLAPAGEPPPVAHQSFSQGPVPQGLAPARTHPCDVPRVGSWD